MNDISVEEGNEQRQRDLERTHEVVATLIEERSCDLVALPHEEEKFREEDHSHRDRKLSPTWLTAHLLCTLWLFIVNLRLCTSNQIVKNSLRFTL
jgi:hypothetical protein